MRPASFVRVPTAPQEKHIFNHLIFAGSITQMEATSLYGIRRLAARILDLKKSSGLKIRTTYERHISGERYARYHLVVD